MALTPEGVSKLRKLKFNVKVEEGAGAKAEYSDRDYAEAGAEISKDVWQSDMILRVNVPTADEIAKMAEGATILSHLYPAQNPDRLQQMTDKKITAFAMDQVPRVTIAQACDVLSRNS